LAQAVVSQPVAAPRNSNPWIVNPWIDTLCVGSVLGMGLFALFYITGYQNRTPEVIAAGYMLSIVCNWPHFAASYVRLYSSMNNVREYASVAVWGPIALTAGVIGTIMAPTVVGPWFCKTFLIWAGHHYSGQTYGIAMIYARKYGYAVSDREKWIIRAPIWMSYIYAVGGIELSGAYSQFFSIQIPNLGPWTAKVFGPGFNTGLESGFGWIYWASLIAFAVWVVAKSIKIQRVFPVAAILVMGSQLLWYNRISNSASFYEFVPFFHCLQYLVVVFAFQRFAWQKEGQNPVVSLAKYFGILILLGGFLFEAVPRALIIVGIEVGLAYAAVLAFINLHHYMIDGVIWKLRKPEIRQALIDQRTG